MRDLLHPAAHRSWPTSTWRVTAADAAVKDGYSDRCSRINRTARSEKAESTLFGLRRIHTTQEDAPKNLRRFSFEIYTKQGHGLACVTCKITGRYEAHHKQYFLKPPLDTLSVPLWWAQSQAVGGRCRRGKGYAPSQQPKCPSGGKHHSLHEALPPPRRHLNISGQPAHDRRNARGVLGRHRL